MNERIMAHYATCGGGALSLSKGAIPARSPHALAQGAVGKHALRSRPGGFKRA